MTTLAALLTRIAKPLYSLDDGVIRGRETIAAELLWCHPASWFQLRLNAKPTKKEMNPNLTLRIGVVLDQEKFGPLSFDAYFFFQFPPQASQRSLLLL